MSRSLISRPMSVALAALFVAAASTARAQQSSGTLRLEPVATAYAGTIVPLAYASATPVRWTTSDPTVAWVDGDGRLVLVREGKAIVSAVTPTDSVAQTITVRRNPARRIVLSLTRDQLASGARTTVHAMALDGAGHELPDVRVTIAASNGTIEPAQDGVTLVAGQAGLTTLIAQTGDASTTREIAVSAAEVAQQGSRGRATAIAIVRPAAPPTVGVASALVADVTRGANGVDRTADVTWSVSDSNVATVTAGGTLTCHKPGHVVVSASLDGVTASEQFDVRANPVARLVLRNDADQVFVGDSVRLRVDAWAPGGRRVDTPNVAFAIVPGPGRATVSNDGVFVASEPGTYTVLVAAGTHADRQTIFVQAHR